MSRHLINTEEKFILSQSTVLKGECIRTFGDKGREIWFDSPLKKNRPRPDAAKLALEAVPEQPWTGNNRIGGQIEFGQSETPVANKAVENGLSFSPFIAI